MTRRAFGWTALAVFLLGANTGVMLWLQGRPGGGGVVVVRGPGGGRELPPETVRRPRPLEAGETMGIPVEPVLLRVQVTDSAGAPLSGALVRVLADRRALRSPFPRPVLAEGATGADGTASLTGMVPLPRYRVEASMEGRAPAAVSGAGPEVALVLPRAGRIGGRVLEEGSALPVPGVTVEADGAASSTADAAGTWTLEGLPPGSHRLRVRSSTHGPPVHPVTVELAEGGAEVVDLVLPRGVDVPGHVVYAGSDKGVEGGAILLRGWAGLGFPPAWEREAALDGAGRFLLRGVPPIGATVCLVVTGEGTVIRASFPKTLPGGGGEVSVTVPWNTPAGLQYRGRITDVRGAPVEGARVVVGDNLAMALPQWDARGGVRFFDEARTDADGRWEIAGAEHLGSEVLVLHPDFAPGYFQLPYRSRSRTFDFALGDPVALLVVVRDAAGRPAEGAEVRVLLRSSNEALSRTVFGDVHDGMMPGVVTGLEGRAVIGPLGPGSWYVVARSAEGGEAARTALRLGEGEATGAVDLVLEPLPRASGRVVDLDGAPVAGALLRAEDGFTGEDFRAVTDAAGGFEFPGVAPPFWPSAEWGVGISVEPPEGMAAGTRYLEATAGEPVTWVLARQAEVARTILVRGVRPGGRPCGEGSWEVRFPGGRGGAAAGWGGEVPGMLQFSLPLVRGRGAVLTVRSPGRGSGSVHLDDLPDDQPTLDLVVE